MFDLKKIAWSKIISDLFEKCQGKELSLSDMEQGIQDGIFQLLGVYQNETFIAAILIRDEFPNLYVVAAGGKTVNGSTYKAVLPFLKKFAKDRNYKTLTAHAEDDLRARALHMAGWQYYSDIFTVKVD